jgi:hypothetical protein
VFVQRALYGGQIDVLAVAHSVPVVIEQGVRFLI